MIGAARVLHRRDEPAAVAVRTGVAGGVPEHQRCRLAADFRFDRIACKEPASICDTACSLSAQRREVDVVTDVLLTNSEQVSDDWGAPRITPGGATTAE